MVPDPSRFILFEFSCVSGTDSIRCPVVGLFMTLLAASNTVKGTINDGMDVEFALKLGKLIGKVYGSPVAIAMDGRTSNVMLKSAIASGMMAVGCDVLDLGAVPTPLIQFYMSKHPDVKGGVTITASFAGQDINGIRLMKSEGIEDPIFDEYTVEDILDIDEQVPASQVGEIIKEEDITEKYIDMVLSQVDAEEIRKAGLKICLDCRNNAVASIASNILMRLSVDCITLGGDTSVLNDDRVTKLGHIVKSQELDLGVAIEMDADHCLFATSEGEPLTGDKSFAVLAKAILSENRGKVVMPVNSSTLMEDVVRDNGGIVLHCSVGEQTVVRKVKENMALLGGDIFGCLVIPGQQTTCDALFAMAKMLEIVVKNGPLSEQTANMPTYYIYRDHLECPEESIPAVLERFKAAHEGEEMDLIDGVKIFRDNGWIYMRHSNVRGVIKVYAQADSLEIAKEWVSETLKGISE